MKLIGIYRLYVKGYLENNHVTVLDCEDGTVAIGRTLHRMGELSISTDRETIKGQADWELIRK